MPWLLFFIWAISVEPVDLCSRPAAFRSPGTLQGAEDRPVGEPAHAIRDRLRPFHRRTPASSHKASRDPGTWWTIKNCLPLLLSVPPPETTAPISGLCGWAAWGHAVVTGTGHWDGELLASSWSTASHVARIPYSVQSEDTFPRKERPFLWKSSIRPCSGVVAFTWKAQTLLRREKLVGNLLFRYVRSSFMCVHAGWGRVL